MLPRPSCVHGLILSHLLGSSALHSILEELLESPAATAAVEVFLKEKCRKSSEAGNFLSKYYLAHGRPTCASNVFQQLAERQDPDIDLLQRTVYLDRALQAAGFALPHSKDLVQELRTKLDIAARVQMPLLRELELLASGGGDNPVVSRTWRESARRQLGSFQQLLRLQDLYQAAVDFSLFHIVIVIMDLSSSMSAVQQKENVARAWVSLFFPPVPSPYSVSEIVNPDCMPSESKLFPLLTVRPTAAFFMRNDSGPVCRAQPPDFHLRASRLLQELGASTQPARLVWVEHTVVTLLEYCNCLWHKACAPHKGDASEGPLTSAEATAVEDNQSREEVAPHPHAEGSSQRAWVALEVLVRRPFNYAHSNVLKFYGDVLKHVPAWLPDLQTLLPPDPAGSRPAVTADDVRTHISRVILAMLDTWATQVDTLTDDRAASEFSGASLCIESVLAEIKSHLQDLQGADPSVNAHGLLTEVKRLEGVSQRIERRQHASHSGTPGGVLGLPTMPGPSVRLP
jgi:hypothetical protein